MVGGVAFVIVAVGHATASVLGLAIWVDDGVVFLVLFADWREGEQSVQLLDQSAGEQEEPAILA